MAWVLRKLKYHTRVSLLGFSFGARAVAGGLHLNAGGHIPGMADRADSESVAEMSGRYLPYRVGLIAPAIDQTWIESCGRHHQALDQVSHFVNMYNPRDPALRRFRFVDKESLPIAGGLTGFNLLTDTRSTFQTGRNVAEHMPPLKIEQFNCSATVGKTHDEQTYLGQCPYLNRMIDVLLWNTDPSDEIIQSLVSNN